MDSKWDPRNDSFRTGSWGEREKIGSRNEPRSATAGEFEGLEIYLSQVQFRIKSV